jgi:hypothetical protein
MPDSRKPSMNGGASLVCYDSSFEIIQPVESARWSAGK